MTDRPAGPPPEHTPHSAEEPRRHEAADQGAAPGAAGPEHGGVEPGVEPMPHPGAPEPEPRPTGRWVPIAVVAAIALIVGGALLWNQSNDDPEPAATPTATATATPSPTGTPSDDATATPSPTDTASSASTAATDTQTPTDGTDGAVAPPAGDAPASPFGPQGQGSAPDNPLGLTSPVAIPVDGGTATYTIGSPQTVAADRIGAAAGDYEGAQFVLLPVEVAYQGAGTYDGFADLAIRYLIPDSDQMIEAVGTEIPEGLSTRDPIGDGGSAVGYVAFPFPEGQSHDGVWELDTMAGDPIFVGER